jgi:prepilin-type processing-associated H-X9-DG protein
MDYSAAMPCTWISPAHTQSYDPNYAVPLSARGNTRNSTSFYGGTATSPGLNPPDNAVYDGVIVRCPWRWQSTDPTTGKQLGQAVANTQGLVKVAQITDGTSKTMMVAEKYLWSDNYEANAAHDSDNRGWTDGWDTNLMRSTCFTPLADSDPIGWDSTLGAYFADDFSKGSFNGIFNVFQFGSAHTGGFNAVFADGSVHTISYDVDAEIFNNLGARNDGASFDSSSFN